MKGISEKRLKILLNRAIETSDGGSVRAYIYLLERECKELNPWMPIDENTPKDRGVLGYVPYKDGGYKSIIGWGCFFECWVSDCGDPIEPTHWQELPEDPKT
jgi:hypothetical protein